MRKVMRILSVCLAVGMAVVLAGVLGCSGSDSSGTSSSTTPAVSGALLEDFEDGDIAVGNNGQFGETGSWKPANGDISYAATVSTDDAHAGTQSLVLSATSYGSASVFLLQWFDTVDVDCSAYSTLNVWVKALDDSNTPFVGLEAKDKSGAEDVLVDVTAYESWAKISLAFGTLTDKTDMKSYTVSLSNGDDTGTGGWNTIYVDDITLE